MGHQSFENYATLAGQSLSNTIKAGRYASQQAAERRILADILAKLDPRPEDRLLDIGCGTGNLVIPLSLTVAETVAIDHAEVLRVLGERYVDPALHILAGPFPEVAPEGPFDAILAYSVLHCLADQAAVARFVDQCATLLAPGGRLLLGDIPNGDAKARFLATEHGQAVDRAYRTATQSPSTPALPADPQCAEFDDAAVLALVARLRRNGLEAYLLPQAADLPFGQTREDILAVRRPA